MRGFEIHRLRPIGVIAALRAEARTFGSGTLRDDRLLRLGDGTLLAVSGIGDAAATRAARALKDAGVTALVSWGTAGALDPALRAGHLVLPNAVITADGAKFETDAHWRAGLATAFAAEVSVGAGLLLTSPFAIDTVAGKLAALRTTHAVAVDMESAAIAQVAAAGALPFIAVRAIVDTAVDVLPRAVLAASGGGEVQLWRLARELAAAPGEILPLLRLASRYRAARRTLLLVARLGLTGPWPRAAQVA